MEIFPSVDIDFERVIGITRKRRLRTGAPVWTSYPRHIAYATQLTRSAKTDILVVGAGISGALVAYRLASAGHRVSIIDRRGPVLGSTLASTALLQFEIDVPLVHLKRKIGARHANQAWIRSKLALDSLYALIRQERIDHTAMLRPSVYLAGSVLNARGLAQEARARQRIGLPSELVNRAQLRRRFKLSRAAAIVSSNNAAADPAKLASGFLRRAQRWGARLWAPHEITEIHSSRHSVTAVTQRGIEIQARQLVLCTGYEFPKLVPAAGHRLASTWAIATRRQPKHLWPEECLIWEANTPYLYARATADGRVICGGEDEDFVDEDRRDEKLPVKAATLERKLGRLLPMIDSRAVFRWAGTFGQTPTGLPHIGAVPGHSRCYAVLGYGGNGITFSMLAAQVISAAIEHRKDPDARLFAFP